MTISRTFPLGVVLSVTTTKLLCSLDAVYDVLGFMTGETLFTHQLPRAFHQCAPEILRQHPLLASANTDSVTPENWRVLLAQWSGVFGPELSLTPLPPEQRAPMDPLAELVAKAWWSSHKDCAGLFAEGGSGAALIR